MIDIPVNILNLPSEGVNFFGKVGDVDGGIMKMVEVSSQVLILFVENLNNLLSLAIFLIQIVDLGFVFRQFALEVSDY
jgi:hypothetical protein